MPETLGTFISAAQQVIQDQAELLTTGTGGEFERAVRQALEQYDNDAPRELIVDQAGNGILYDFDLPADFTYGYSRFVSIEYPAGNRPATMLLDPDWEIYRTSSTTKLRLKAITPGSGESLRYVYTARHTIDELDAADETTIPGWHTEAFVLLVASKALTILATRFIHEQESTINADSVDRNSKTDIARRMADRLMAAYREIVGVRGGASAASAIIDWNSTFANSSIGMLTHNRRRVR